MGGGDDGTSPRPPNDHADPFGNRNFWNIMSHVFVRRVSSARCADEGTLIHAALYKVSSFR